MSRSPENPRTRTVKLGDFDKRHAKPSPPAHEPDFERDHGYENSTGVREALAAINRGDPAILVHGGAGVGKTHFVNYLQKLPGGGRQVVVAPTGIAALSVRGQTIHSLFWFPPQLLDPKNLDRVGKGLKLWKELDRVIIDEISMVRVDVLDAIDKRLRQYRKGNKPFGGAQLLMVGDPLQLPPVLDHTEAELLKGMGYATPFLHSALSLKEIELSGIELGKVFRQTDPKFISVLDSIRRRERINASIDFLNDHCHRPHRDADSPALMLTPTKAAADSHNQHGLNALKGTAKTYHAKTTGKFDIQKDRLPAPEELTLKVGAEVMAVKNKSGQWLNGSRGRIVDLLDNVVKVRFNDREEVQEVEPATWEKVRQKWNSEHQRVETEVVAKYTQIPLILGWAVTIHKSQGLTLKDVRVDLRHGTFATGQLYVALSRATSLAGLSLTRPLQPGDVKVDQNMVDFVDWISNL